MSNNQKICLIAGCGPGTGTESVKKFSQEGYKVIMLLLSVFLKLKILMLTNVMYLIWIKLKMYALKLKMI